MTLCSNNGDELQDSTGMNHAFDFDDVDRTTNPPRLQVHPHSSTRERKIMNPRKTVKSIQERNSLPINSKVRSSPVPTTERHPWLRERTTQAEQQ